MAKTPFLTQKVESRVRKVCIGQDFLLALRDDGLVVSWGTDAGGCLGLGQDKTTSPEPSEIGFPDKNARICDIVLGEKHCMALAENGKVYSWGSNEHGQLGAKDSDQPTPVLIDTLKDETVLQICCVKSSSFCLTDKGAVWAWGQNDHGQLALGDAGQEDRRVRAPRPMSQLDKHKVLRLEVQGDAVLAYIDTDFTARAFSDVGKILNPLGGKEAGGGGGSKEKELLHGIDLMRKILESCNKWYEFMLRMKHGGPGEEGDGAGQGAPNIDVLTRAVHDLENLIHLAEKQRGEVKEQAGQKNCKFVLSLFIDACQLRKEKIERMLACRLLCEIKRKAKDMPKDTETPDLAEVQECARTLHELLQTCRNCNPKGDLTVCELQKAVVQTLECKLQLCDTQIEILKAKNHEPCDSTVPGLRIIKDRWNVLKHFSLYNLYTECDQQKYDFGDDDQMMQALVNASDQKINQVMDMDKEKVLSRDSLIPSLCYDLLQENAELRKMCNSYQLKILVFYKGSGRAKTRK